MRITEKLNKVSFLVTTNSMDGVTPDFDLDFARIKYLNREEYYEAFNRLIQVGTRPETQIEVVTPLIHMGKADIVREGVRLEAPIHLTWSCYTESDIACGRCESCGLRLKGFREAGLADPVTYRS